MIGTPGYCPPEQYQGLADPRSDVYSLGATLHHLISGRDPRRHQPFTFPPLSTLVPAINSAVDACPLSIRL
jgi:serine/threonine-protein kinase